MSDQRLRLHRSSLARQILIAIGLPAAVASTAAASCGGEAVVDPDGSGGGSATTTQSSSSSSSTTSTTTPTWTEGRPFSVDGVARVAEARPRDDWHARELVPMLEGLDRRSREALAAKWEQDARFEHASIASFARFILELLAVGAPPELVRDANQALADEVRHAEQCFAMASAYRGEPTGPAPLPIADSIDQRADLADIAVATVHEGCINETLATLAAMAAQDGAEDPAVREVLGSIVTDEAKHAALAWRFVAWACRQDGAVKSAVAAAFDRGLHADLPPVAHDEALDEAVLRAHGRLPAHEQAQIARHSLAEVIEPCVRSLLAEEASTDRIAPQPSAVS